MRSPWLEAIGVLVETVRAAADDELERLTVEAVAERERRALDAVAALLTEHCRLRRDRDEEIREAARDARAAASEGYERGRADAWGRDW